MEERDWEIAKVKKASEINFIKEKEKIREWLVRVGRVIKRSKNFEKI